MLFPHFILGAESRGTQAGLFSAVSSAFVIDVQSKLEPDPNEMTAAYMRILIHTLNNSLFPDADPSSVAWTGPPPEIVTVQSLLYASLTTSLFTAFLAMLGKQWVNLYLRNDGGSAADKSRNRQRKLDGFEKWYFHLTIESLPVMLQVALLLLGCALSKYLWMISHTVAGVIAGVTLFGVTSYVFLTLAATLYNTCPYQTPPSVLARNVIDYLARGDGAFANSLRSFMASFPSIKVLRRTVRRLRAGVRRAQERSGCILGVGEETGDIPLAVATSPLPTRAFKDTSIDWEVRMAETRCIAWVLSSTTDIDVIYSAVRFAADASWYPRIAGALSPHILADHFSDCMLDVQVVPGKLEYASSIGMALASVLSTQLTVEPGNQALRGLSERICKCVRCPPSSGPAYLLVVATLRFIGNPGDTAPMSFRDIPNNLSVPQKLWLSRIALQTIWRRRCVVSSPFLPSNAVFLACGGSTADDVRTPAIIKTNCLLAFAICLGLRINVRDLYAPDNRCVVPPFVSLCHSSSVSNALDMAILLFHRQIQRSIREGKVAAHCLTEVLCALSSLDPFQTGDNVEYGFLWIADLLSSGYPDYERYYMAGTVIGLLGKHVDHTSLWQVRPGWVSSLVRFLSLGERFYSMGYTPFPGLFALRILSSTLRNFDFTPTILPVLASTLMPTHPLQSRHLALDVFRRFMAGWSPSQMENVPNNRAQLLRAVGDPFQFPDLPLQDGQPVVTADYDPIQVVVILIGFASSDLWRNHLCRSNFASCEEILSTDEGRRDTLKWVFDTAIRKRPEFLCPPTEIIAAITRLEELQCPNTTEVVILWAWTAGVVNAVGHDAWGLIERKTLDFYQTHGIRRLTTLSRHTIDTTMELPHLRFILRHDRGPSPCTEGAKPVPLAGSVRRLDGRHLKVAQACQLRRLYQLFGHDPTTWKEAVTVEGVDENMGIFSGQSITPTQYTDWACDYP